MREILFRAKGKKEYNDGDWYEGLLTQFSDGDYQICIDGKVFRTIDPETVGQYTGLTDKNGKKVFEGHIVYDHEENEVGLVEMSSACWVIRKNKGKWDFLGNRVQKFMLNCPLEVIGNIYDNPELLEGRQ